ASVAQASGQPVAAVGKQPKPLPTELALSEKDCSTQAKYCRLCQLIVAAKYLPPCQSQEPPNIATATEAAYMTTMIRRAIRNFRGSSIQTYSTFFGNMG